MHVLLLDVDVEVHIHCAWYELLLPIGRTSTIAFQLERSLGVSVRSFAGIWFNSNSPKAFASNMGRSSIERVSLTMLPQSEPHVIKFRIDAA